MNAGCGGLVGEGGWVGYMQYHFVVLKAIGSALLSFLFGDLLVLKRTFVLPWTSSCCG